MTGGTVDALVTDAQARAAVAGVRALGRAGLATLALGTRLGAPALWSRYTARRAVGPGTDDPVGFVARIGELAREHGPLVVFPAQEEALDPLSERREALPREAIVPLASAEALRALRDKSRLAGLAADAGLHAPAALVEGPAGAIAADPPPAPCVVKSIGLSPALPAPRVAETDAELRAILAPLPPDDPLIIQERLTGPLVGLALVLDRAGAVVARFQQVARRVWPMPAGGSSFAMSVAPDEDLVARSAAMLTGVGFWGLAQLQFLTGRSGGPALIDVNPRFYGSMPLATASGVNLPAAWQAVAIQAPVPAAAPYRVGVTYRWLEGDITAAWNGFHRHLLEREARARAGAMWASDDPVPGALLAAEAAWLRVRRRLPASPWA